MGDKMEMWHSGMGDACTDVQRGKCMVKSEEMAAHLKGGLE